MNGYICAKYHLIQIWINRLKVTFSRKMTKSFHSKICFNNVYNCKNLFGLKIEFLLPYLIINVQINARYKWHQKTINKVLPQPFPITISFVRLHLDYGDVAYVKMNSAWNLSNLDDGLENCVYFISLENLVYQNNILKI